MLLQRSGRCHTHVSNWPSNCHVPVTISSRLSHLRYLLQVRLKGENGLARDMDQVPSLGSFVAEYWMASEI